MKKLIILIAVAFFAFGCEGPQGPPGPQGRPGEGVSKSTVEFTLYSKDWKKWTTDNGAFLGWTFVADVPELTKPIFERGLCNVYLWEGNIQKQLPVTIYNEIDGQPYEGLIWYDFAVGSVAFYYQENDFKNENVRPATMNFRIQLIS